MTIYTTIGSQLFLIKKNEISENALATVANKDAKKITLSHNYSNWLYLSLKIILFLCFCKTQHIAADTIPKKNNFFNSYQNFSNVEARQIFMKKAVTGLNHQPS